MESQGKRDHWDSSSESSRQSKKEKTVSESFIYKLDWFPITTSPWIASFAFLFNILFIIHLIDFYSILSHKVHQGQASVTLISGFITTDIGVISYVCNVIICFLIIQSTFFSRNDQEGFKYIMGWLGSKIFPILRYLLQINLAIAAFFLIKNVYSSIFFFIAAIINVFVSFTSQNYNLRKDYLCCKSMEFLLVQKIIIILSYMINCIGYYLIDQNQYVFLSFICIHLLLSLIFIISYLSFGYHIYRHTISQVLQVITLSLYFSLSAGCLYDQVLNITQGKTETNRFLIYSAILFAFVCLFFYSYWSKLKNLGTNIKQENLVKRIFFTYCKLDNSSEDINDDCQIRGLIKYHLQNQCLNPLCFVNELDRKYYDSKKNRVCFPQKLNQGKSSFVKFYIKCFYEEQLEYDQWRNPNLILQYIEFMYMKLKNVYKVSFLLKVLEDKFLTPFQKLQLTRIKRVMIEENQHLNEELYHGRLDIENVIYSQIKFNEIRGQLNTVLKRNIQFWNYVEKNEINLSEMTNLMKPNFKLIDKINENWKYLVKYFEIQKIWKFFFVMYTLYIKNEKIKPQFLQYFGHSIHEDEIYIFDSIYIDKTTQLDKLYNSKMLFDPNTCCIHVSPTTDKIAIKKVSRYFEKLFGYNQNEVCESSIQILMTPSVQKFHYKLFYNWAGSGKSNNQTTYSIKKIFPVNKIGYIIPCYKFYKQYLCENKQLQYVAMLKKNREDENVILLNQMYEIEGITESLTKKWKLSHLKYENILGISLFTIFPSIVDLIKTFNKQKIMKGKSMKSFHSEGLLNDGQDEHDKKDRRKSFIGGSFTKSNLKVKVYDDFKTIKELYLQIKQSTLLKDPQVNKNTLLLQVFDNMKQMLKTMSISKELNVQVDLKEKTIEGTDFLYIQLYILESEEIIKESFKMDDVEDMSDNVLEEIQAEQEDFSKFFQSSVSSQKISLTFSDNIFIKQENNEAVDMIEHVYSITVSVRIIFVFFFGLVLGSMFMEYNNYIEYDSTINKLNSLVNFHLSSLNLDNYYYSKIMGRSSATQIKTITNYLLQIKIDKYFKQSLLDEEINEKFYYTRYGQTSPEYDQIDLIRKLFLNMIDISYSQNGQVTVNSTSFLDYEKLIFPSTNQLLNKAQKNVDSQFGAKKVQTQEKNSIFYGVESILLILGFVLILSKLLTISASFQSLMEIFTQLNEVDIKKIKKYCKFIQKLFELLGQKYQKLTEQSFENDKRKDKDKQENSKQLSRSLENEQNLMYGTMSGIIKDPEVDDNENDEINANLNKKVKKVTVGTDLRNIKIKSIVLVVVFLLIFGTTSFGLNIYISQTAFLIDQYQKVGYEVFQYYSLMDLYLLAMKQKNIFQEDFDSRRYETLQENIQKMKLLKQVNLSQFPLDLTFPTKFNVIFFDNFCQKYPSVLDNNTKLQQCQEVAENNVQHGVKSFLFYLSANVKNYLNSSSYDLSQELLYNLQIGLDICDIYLKHLLDLWKTEFVEEISRMSQSIIIICSCLIVFHGIVYVLLIQIMIVGNLKSTFLFFRKIYEGLMPDFIVTKEKIIKAKLIVEGIIKK